MNFTLLSLHRPTQQTRTELLIITGNAISTTWNRVPQKRKQRASSTLEIEKLELKETI